MRLRNITEVNDFLATVDKASGDVYLISMQGDRFNLKSKLSQFVAIGALLNNHGSDLELFCEHKGDEGLFLKFFYAHPEVNE